MALQTEKWNVLIKQWGGLFTARDSDDISDDKSPDLLNVRVIGSHFRGANGYELAGSRNSIAGEITSKETYTREDEKQIMVRIRDDGATGVMEWFDAVNLRWYTLLTGLTTGEVMGFAEFNTSTANQFIFCNGIENISVWTGATTRLSEAISGSPTSINVVDTTDFPSSGTIIYNGTEVTYTSKTTGTFVKSSGTSMIQQELMMVLQKPQMIPHTQE